MTLHSKCNNNFSPINKKWVLFQILKVNSIWLNSFNLTTQMSIKMTQTSITLLNNITLRSIQVTNRCLITGSNKVWCQISNQNHQLGLNKLSPWIQNIFQRHKHIHRIILIIQQREATIQNLGVNQEVRNL